MTAQKPAVRPHVAHFSSGPCAKRPGYSVENLKSACLGRSHRAKPGKARLKLAIDETREVLGVPADYLIGIVAGLRYRRRRDGHVVDARARGIHVLAWESFGKDWVIDITKQLKLRTCACSRRLRPLPDLSKVANADLVFAWNGTTSGVRVPNGDFIRPTARACHLRRHQRRLRPGPRLGQARCRHLLLAESAGRRGGARHADPVAARGGPAGKLHAALADAEDVPHDQGRQGQPRHLRGRDHQHALDAGVEDYLDALKWARIGGLRR